MGLWSSLLPFSSTKQEATTERLNEGKRAANELRDYYGTRYTYRNLLLGTARDGNFASKVTLFSAEEIVMNDGYRATGWQNVSAAITSSGAGGLDTGSEVAGTWYDIYALQRSADDAKALLLSKQRVFTQLTGAADASSSTSITSSANKLGQGFQVLSGNIPLSWMDVHLAKTGAPTGLVYFTINADSGGFPSATVLATSDFIDISRIGTTATYVRVFFRSGFLASAATQYHVVLNFSAAAIDVSNYLAWSRSTTNVYASGAASSFNGTVWSASPATADFVFSYVTLVEPAALALPTGYDRYARIGAVYNNGGSNFDYFAQQNRNVFLAPTSVGSFSNAYASGIGLYPFLPSFPVTGIFGLTHTAGGSVLISAGDSPRTTYAQGATGGLAPTANAAHPQLIVEMWVEGQIIYVSTSASTATVVCMGYRW